MAGKIDPATGLQDQQRRFADEYLVDFNGTAAYMRAGYKATGAAASAAAARLLANSKVQAYLASRKEELLLSHRVDQEGELTWKSVMSSSWPSTCSRPARMRDICQAARTTAAWSRTTS